MLDLSRCLSRCPKCEHCKEEVAKWDYDDSRASVSQGEYLDINGEQVYNVCVILPSPPSTLISIGMVLV